MVTQELIKQVLEPDPENEDLSFNKTKYLEIQKIEKRDCPLCGNTLQERKDKALQDKLSRFRCQSKPCEKRRNELGVTLLDLLLEKESHASAMMQDF